MSVQKISNEVTIDCSVPISYLISDAGYNSKDVDLGIDDSAFPPHRPRCKCHLPVSTKSVHLVCLGIMEISTDKVLDTLRSNGLVLGGIREYLHLVTAYPYLKDRVAIMRGSTFAGVNQNAVSAWRDGVDVHKLSFISLTRKWGDKVWFVAVNSANCGCAK